MTNEEEVPRYTPNEAQHWSTDRSHKAECEECGPLFSDTTGSSEHWLFTAARDHCAKHAHTVKITSVTYTTVSPAGTGYE